jgi:HK97 gp10 family phage protein
MLAGLVDPRTLMRRATLIVEAQAKRESPVRTGHLRRSITSRVDTSGKRGYVGTNVRYAQAVHEGTRARTIRPRSANALAFRVGNARVVRKSVRHPGTKANPFLRRAFDKARPRVERELGGVIQANVVPR